MNLNRHIGAFLIGTILVLSGRSATADVVVFTERAAWEAAAGPFDTITFTEYPDFTPITDQYLDSYGIEFTDGLDFINFSPAAYEDDFGLRGAGDIEITFSTPQSWLAVDFPGVVRITLFSGSEQVFSSINMGGSGPGWFGGVVSATSFDSVVLDDTSDGFVAIDNLYFGAAIPTPAGAALLVTAIAIGYRRRRRRRSEQ